MSAPSIRHKHLKLDQRTIDFARRYFGVTCMAKSPTRRPRRAQEVVGLLESEVPAITLAEAEEPRIEARTFELWRSARRRSP